MGSKFNDWCLYKKRRGHTEGHTGKAMWQQRQMVEWCSNKPRNAKGCWQSPETGREYESDSPSETTEGISPADTLIMNFSPPEQWENKCLLYEATQFMMLYYGSPRKLIYHLVSPLWRQDTVHIFKRYRWTMGQSENSNAYFSTSLDTDQWMLLKTNVCRLFVYLKSFYSVCQVGRTLKLCLLLKVQLLLFAFCGSIACCFNFKGKESKMLKNEAKKSFISISKSLILSKHNSIISMYYILTLRDQIYIHIKR